MNVPVSGFEFADQPAFRTVAVAQEPGFAHVVGKHAEQQGIRPETPECSAFLSQVGTQ